MPDSTQLAKTIAGDFYNGRFDLTSRGLDADTTWSLMPEVEAEHQLRALGASKRITRVFLTLVSAMDRARDSTRLWRISVGLFKQHPVVFRPDEVLKMSIGRLSTLLREAGVSQRHRKDSEAWHRIACSLVSGNGPICRLVDTGAGDSVELLKDLHSRDHAGQSRYPLLRGPKLGPVWLRIMASPGGAKIECIESIPVAVDVHVRRATENLGVSDTMGLGLRQAKRPIQAAWRSAVLSADTGGPPGISGTCAALDPALWFFGKHGCSHCEKVRQRSPISSACHSCQYPVSPHEQ